MNRRRLLIRTLTGAFSATVFTATGWLMGTKTLTMPQPPPDCGQGCVPPNECDSICWHYPGWACVSTGCTNQLQACRPSYADGLGCDYFCTCLCGTSWTYGTCGQDCSNTSCPN